MSELDALETLLQICTRAEKSTREPVAEAYRHIAGLARQMIFLANQHQVKRVKRPRRTGVFPAAPYAEDVFIPVINTPAGSNEEGPNNAQSL